MARMTPSQKKARENKLVRMFNIPGSFIPAKDILAGMLAKAQGGLTDERWQANMKLTNRELARRIVDIEAAEGQKNPRKETLMARKRRTRRLPARNKKGQFRKSKKR